MTATDFSAMVVRHEEYLHPFAVSLTRDHDDAKDLYQETMLRALLNQEKYQFGTNLEAWLYTIMRNIFINSYRRNKRIVKVDAGVHGEAMMQAAGLAAVNDGWSHLRLGEIRNVMDRLPQIFRLSFELYFTGYKYQEIADLTSEPLGTIKSRIHFARKMMMSQLER